MIRDQMLLQKKLLTLELLVISISGAKALPLISPAALFLSFSLIFEYSLNRQLLLRHYFLQILLR
jgi:hypothetical protein